MYSNLAIIKSKLHINKLEIYEDASCAIEPCLNYQKCSTDTKFLEASSKYLQTANVHFRPIRLKHEFSCSCPIGFTGTNSSLNCDLEINLCYSNPCGNNGVCISLESSFICICDPNFTGKTCEINLKSSKCCDLNNSKKNSNLNESICVNQVCKSNSMCRNLILGGFVCDKCDKPYLNEFCELRTRHFPKNSNSYISLPGIQNRFRFKLKLSFATIKSNSYLFYNGRLDSYSNDFISLQIQNDYLKFTYSLGDNLVNELSITNISVSDGKWRTVSLDYENRLFRLSLDNDNFEQIDSCDLAFNPKNSSNSNCFRQFHTYNLPTKCLNQIESCFRYFDLNAPLILGQSLKPKENNLNYEGCIRDLYLNEKLIDLQEDILYEQNTLPGCAPKESKCNLNECSKCSHLWSNKINCNCKNENFEFNNSLEKCIETQMDVFGKQNDGFILFDQKEIKNKSKISLEFKIKLNNSNNLNQFLILSLKILHFEFKVIYDKLKSKLSLTSEHILLEINKNLENQEYWNEIEIIFTPEGSLELKLNEIFSSRIRLEKIETIFQKNFYINLKFVQGFSGCIKNIKLNQVKITPKELYKVSKGCNQENTSENICSKSPCFNSGICTEIKDQKFNCTCLNGFKGEYCQFEKVKSSNLFQNKTNCPAKWWGKEPGICGPCNCDESKNFSPDCDKTTGECKCKSKYYKKYNPFTQQEHCVPCDCYLEGSSSLQCEQYTGQCKCTPGAGITGRRCDQCVSPLAEMSSKGNECRQLTTSECPKAFAFNIWWPRTQFNLKANSTCPKGSTGLAYRTCTPNGWSSSLDLSECRSVKIQELINPEKLNSYQAFKLVEELNKLTLESELDEQQDYNLNQLSTSLNSLYAIDLILIKNLTKYLIEYEIQNAPAFLYTHKIFQILNRILSKKYDLKLTQINSKGLLNDLLSVLNKYIELILKSNENDFEISQSDLYFRTKTITSQSYSDFVENSFKFKIQTGDKRISFLSLNSPSNNFPNKLILESRISNKLANYRVVSNLFILNSNDQETKMQENGTMYVVVEFLLTNNYETIYDSKMNQIEYKNLKSSKFDFRCAHLDLEQNAWSTKGAKLIAYDPSTNIVKCSYQQNYGVYSVLTPIASISRNNQTPVEFSMLFDILMAFSLVLIGLVIFLLTLLKVSFKILINCIFLNF